MHATFDLVPVCRVDQIDRESGVAALVHGRAVAIFRTFDDEIHALGNYDPFGRASVLARGIVGTRTVEGVEIPFVASPLHKQAFDLRTGRCLDHPEAKVSVYAVEISEGMVLVGGVKETGERFRQTD